MSKRQSTPVTAPASNGRARRESKRAARVATAPATVDTSTDIVTIAPDGEPATVPASTGPRALTFTDFGVDAPANVPAHIPAMVASFRAIAPMPVKTPAERIAARDAFIAAMTANGVKPVDGGGKHTGRFTAQPVFVAQNDMYLAMALANVVIESGHVMAAWAAEFPMSTCGRNVDGCNGVPYIGRDYAWSTLSEYIHVRHGRTSVDNGRVVIATWASRGRKPIDA